MAFDAKRLRVQIPCREDSVVEVEPAQPITALPGVCRMPTVDHRLSPLVTPGGCWRFGSRIPVGPGWGTGTPQQEPQCVNHNSEPPEPCGHTPISDFCPDRHENILVDPDPSDAGRVLLRPGDLPRLRRQLEAEMTRLDALVEHRDNLEGTLSELDSVEEKLQQRSRET
jgi:hypothetical protein